MGHSNHYHCARMFHTVEMARAGALPSMHCHMLAVLLYYWSVTNLAAPRGGSGHVVIQTRQRIPHTVCRVPLFVEIDPLIPILSYPLYSRGRLLSQLVLFQYPLPVLLLAFLLPVLLAALWWQPRVHHWYWFLPMYQPERVR